MTHHMEQFLLSVSRTQGRHHLRTISTKVHMTPHQLVKIYEDACEHLDVRRMEDYCLSHAVKSHFHFMDKLFMKFIIERQFKLIPLPYFDSSTDFQSIVKNLTEHDFNKGLLKKFGLMVEEFGVVFLNNVYCLKLIYGPDLNIHEVLRLDHSRRLNLTQAKLLQESLILKDYYSLSRMWKIVGDAHLEYIQDINHLLHTNVSKEIILGALPKKPKNAEEVHNSLSLAIMLAKQENFPLNQDIEYLDGQNILDFTIEVPKDSHTLVTTSKELKHCVHSYDKRVINKECQILNLKKNNKRLYTVELNLNGPSPSIRQFKGFANDNAMEKDDGIEYRKRLFELLEKTG